MKARLLVPGTLLIAALLAFGGCGGTEDGTDGGKDAGDGGIDECELDNSTRRNVDPEWKLEAAAEGSLGYICPKSDIDHFWFEVAMPQTIVEVTLKNNVNLSPVDLCYDVYQENQDAKLGGKCDYDGMDGVTEVIGTHYLQSAGRYFLEVRDANADEDDARNAYILSLDTVQDPDTYEPNNTADEAKAVGMQKGYISYLEDEDWFKIDGITTGQVMIIDLTTDAANQVDLRYTLYAPDKTTPVNAGEDFNGMDGAAAMHDTLPLREPGTYYLQIVDIDGDDSDLEVGYTLQVSVRNDPDPRDQSAPFNNTWDTATPITSGQTISNGYFSARGDEDWYKITKAGVTDTSPALIEVELQMNASSPVDPAIDLIVADPRTDCSPGDDCDLLETWECGGCENIKDCQDAQCPSHECFTQLGKCTGAGMCLPRLSGNGCGIRSLIMHGADWSQSGSPRHLKTIAPMYGDTYYILARDFRSDAVDLDHAYTLTVTTHDEQDTHEPNGMYLPYLTGIQEDETRRWNRNLAKDITCNQGADDITCGPITGYLSYRGDQDWYKLSLPGQDHLIPSEPEADPPTMGETVDWDVVFTYNFNGRSDMIIGYAFPFGQEMGPEATGSGTWGDGGGECSYFCGEYHTPARVYLWVFNVPELKKYDHQNPYSVSIRATRACPANCSFCEAGQTYYPCPNPNNPNPGGDE